jgi:hypothetical protein
MVVLRRVVEVIPAATKKERFAKGGTALRVPACPERSIIFVNRMVVPEYPEVSSNPAGSALPLAPFLFRHKFNLAAPEPPGNHPL